MSWSLGSQPTPYRILYFLNTSVSTLIITKNYSIFSASLQHPSMHLPFGIVIDGWRFVIRLELFHLVIQFFYFPERIWVVAHIHRQ